MFNNDGEDATAGQIDGPARIRRPNRGLLRRLFKDKSGTSVIEFALLAIPFMMVIFASLETFTAFTAEQLLANRDGDDGPQRCGPARLPPPPPGKISAKPSAPKSRLS